jgi:heme/copper-type cytochrome/quinol oxidase subunit 3
MAEASQDRPLGMMVPPVPHGTEIPPEPADVGGRALYLAGRLLAGSTTFFFLAFVFAYFYLRSLNQSHMWRPPHVGPQQGFGLAIVLVLVASAALAIAGGRMFDREQSGWLRPATAALLLGLVAVVLQCIAYTTQDFGPADGAYASVYVAWTAFYLLAVLAALYWLETNIATELRARRRPAAHGDIANPDRLIKPGVDAGVFYWSFLVGIGVLTYVILYLI